MSIVTIENDDQLCMARAIGGSWVKLKRCTPEEWKEITKDRQNKTNLQLMQEKQQVPESYFKQQMNKQRYTKATGCDHSSNGQSPAGTI